MCFDGIEARTWMMKLEKKKKKKKEDKGGSVCVYNKSEGSLFRD